MNMRFAVRVDGLQMLAKARQRQDVQDRYGNRVPEIDMRAALPNASDIFDKAIPGQPFPNQFAEFLMAVDTRADVDGLEFLPKVQNVEFSEPQFHQIRIVTQVHIGAALVYQFLQDRIMTFVQQWFTAGEIDLPDVLERWAQGFERRRCRVKRIDEGVRLVNFPPFSFFRLGVPFGAARRAAGPAAHVAEITESEVQITRQLGRQRCCRNIRICRAASLIEHIPKAAAAGILRLVTFPAPLVALATDHLGAQINERFCVPDFADGAFFNVSDRAFELATRLRLATDCNMEAVKRRTAKRFSLAKVAF